MLRNYNLNTQGRQNIAPDKIPWAALKTLMAQSIYGGRIDNEFDQRLLNTFLDRIFTKGSFDSGFKLALKVDGHKDIKMPDGIRSVVAFNSVNIPAKAPVKQMFSHDLNQLKMIYDLLQA